MFKNIESVKAANKAAGYHWFSKDTMRFFNTRLCTAHANGPVLSGNRFITSEKYGDEPQLYTIRSVSEDGGIDTVGRFQGYATLGDARKAMHSM